jgi:hypothetical protein
MEKGCNVRETNGMEREKEQGDETLSRDVLQASVILLFALLFFFFAAVPMTVCGMAGGIP